MIAAIKWLGLAMCVTGSFLIGYGLYTVEPGYAMVFWGVLNIFVGLYCVGKVAAHRDAERKRKDRGRR